MKAADPLLGGRSNPPTEATVSIAPAMCAGKPDQLYERDGERSRDRNVGCARTHDHAEGRARNHRSALQAADQRVRKVDQETAHSAGLNHAGRRSGRRMSPAPSMPRAAAMPIPRYMVAPRPGGSFRGHHVAKAKYQTLDRYSG